MFRLPVLRAGPGVGEAAREQETDVPGDLPRNRLAEIRDAAFPRGNHRSGAQRYATCPLASPLHYRRFGVDRDRPAHDELRPDPEASRTHNAIFTTHGAPAGRGIAQSKALGGLPRTRAFRSRTACTSPSRRGAPAVRVCATWTTRGSS